MASVSLQYNNAAIQGFGSECTPRVPVYQQERNTEAICGPIVDPAVYTNNSQFRLLLNYKLSDKTQTALHLSAPPTLRLFTRSCITCIGPHVWRVPHAPAPIPLRRSRAQRCGKQAGDNRVTLPMDTDTGIEAAIKELLLQQGHPDGQ